MVKKSDVKRSLRFVAAGAFVGLAMSLVGDGWYGAFAAVALVVAFGLVTWE